MNFIWLLFGLLLFFVQVNSDRVEIFVPKGPIVGENYSVLGRVITRFLGIPYAKPPVGKLRFRRPVPIEKYNQSIQALEWPNNCFQIPKLKSRFINQNFSEDCLYLNIWSPDVNEVNLRPVVVWIYGGGLIRGGTSDRLYDMERMAVMTDAVMVSINYRLSGLGFFYSDQVEEIKGNQGLWDQALALQWINENIRYFGGNSKAITLMGNSAGSWSVSLHILSPITRNLFQYAIMMSGAANYYVVEQPEKLIPKLLNAIRLMNCSITENNNNIGLEMVECMEKINVEELDKISDARPFVVVDGEFIPEDPKKMIINGNHKKDFNLLVSTVENEGSFFFPKYYPEFNTSKTITLDEVKNILIATLKDLNGETKFDSEIILKTYFGGLNKYYDDSNLFKKQVDVALGDLVLSCPTIKFAKNLYKSSPSTINVYQWYYTAKIGRIKDLCNNWGGTCHTDELYPTFGLPFGEEHLYHNRERELSNEITNFIKSFIRTGKPGNDQQEWLNYFMSSNGQNVIAPYYEISNEQKTYQSFKFNLKQLECDVVWEEFYQ